jgi:hypothetical protein
MAGKKEAGAEKKGRPLSDRKRMAYLRIRYAEMRKESAAVKKEMADLRQKLGANKGGKGKAAADAGED